MVRVEIEMRVRDGKESVKKVWAGGGGSRGVRGRMGWSLGNGWPRRQRQEGGRGGRTRRSVRVSQGPSERFFDLSLALAPLLPKAAPSVESTTTTTQPTGPVSVQHPTKGPQNHMLHATLGKNAKCSSPSLAPLSSSGHSPGAAVCPSLFSDSQNSTRRVGHYKLSRLRRVGGKSAPASQPSQGRKWVAIGENGVMSTSLRTRRTGPEPSLALVRTWLPPTR